MKTLKKLFSVSAIVALLGTLAPMYAFGAGNSLDLDPEFPAAYAYAYANGITTQSEANVDMGGKLTRIAMAKMIAKYAINVLKLTPDTSKACTFADVTAALDTQYDNGVTLACQLGLMGQNMPENKFRPNDLVTRAEFGTTLSRAMNANSDDLATMNAANPYYKDHLNFLNAEGIMTKIDNPSMQEVRGYVMLMMMRSDENYTAVEGCTAEELLACFNADDYDACIAKCADEPEEPEEPTGNGSVTVSKVGSSSTQNVARNAVNKKIGSIKLTAGEDGATVSSVVVKHSGLGHAEDIELQLYKDGVAISDGKAMSTSSQSATLKIKPALSIKAGKSETVDVYASVDSAYANDTHNFTVTKVNLSDGKATETSIALDTLVTTSYTVKNVTVTQTDNTIKAGDTNTLINSLTIIPAAKATIKGITLTRKSGKDVTEALTNVKAYINDEEVGKVTITEDKIAISNLNITKNNGESVVIDVKADGIYVGDAGDKIVFEINAGDVIVIEDSTDENMRPTAIADATLTLSTLSLTLKNMVTKSQTVAPGTSNVELFNGTITAKADIEVSDYQVTITADGNNFTDGVVTLYVDGEDTEIALSTTAGNAAAVNAAVTAAQAAADNDACIAAMTVTANDSVTNAAAVNAAIATAKAGTACKTTAIPAAVDSAEPITIKTFTAKNDRFTVNANKTLSIKVMGNTKSDADGTVKVAFQINKVKNVEENNEITFVKSVNGHTTTIGAGSFTISKTSNIPNNTTIMEGQDSEVLYFDLKAASENQILKQVTVTDTLSAGFANVSKLSLMQGEDEIASVSSDDFAGNTAVFKDFSYTLKTDEKTSFVVVATVDNGEVTALGTNVQVKINALADVKAYRSTNTAVATTAKGTAVAGNPYQIASNTPAAKIESQEGGNTIITLENTSSYDVKYKTIEVAVTRNKNGDSFINWAGTLRLLDSVNGTVVPGSWDDAAAPGTRIYTFTNYEDLNEVVLELTDPNNTLTADDYTVEVKSARFQYYDNGTANGIDIKATFNGISK